MAYGAVDLRTGVAADAFVAAVERELAHDKAADHVVEVWVNEHGEHVRVTLFANWGNIWLGGVVARVAGDVQRALLGLDLLLGVAVRPNLIALNARCRQITNLLIVKPLAGGPDLAANPDGTLTGAAALAAAAALYDVAADRMVRAVRETANAFESLQIVFTPLAPWWDALGVTYPIPDLGEPTITLPGAGV